MSLKVGIAVICFSSLVLRIVGSSFGQTEEEVCHKGTWTNCGIAVKRALEKRPADPKRVVELAGFWGSSYGERYDFLRRQGLLEKSTPDSQKIFEEVNSRLNPIEIAKDKIEEAFLKRYLSLLASVVVWANKPLAVALKSFFESSVIATDYQELELMNRPIQQLVISSVESHLRPDWREKLGKAVEAAGPQIKKP